MLDSLQILIWGVTYLLIIIAGFQNRTIKCISMPYMAGVLNISWEICAFVKSGGFWGHILWLGLDIIIVYFAICFLVSNKSKNIFVVKVFLVSMMFSYLFQFSNGMLYLSFAINIIMSIWYILCRGQISSKFKIIIAMTKMIGSAIAGIFYAEYSVFIIVMAVITLVCDIIYLSLCMNDKYEIVKRKCLN